VVLASGERLRRSAGAEIDGRQRVSHVTRVRAAGRRVADAELAIP
jgi:hypothetical protein